eukprot:614159-Ditylum_brightwellii.AAC.1
MANDISCLAAEKKVKELQQVLKNLNIYDDEAESVFLSAVGGVVSEDYTVYGSEIEDVQNISKSNVLEFFDMDKSKDNKHNQ